MTTINPLLDTEIAVAYTQGELLLERLSGCNPMLLGACHPDLEWQENIWPDGSCAIPVNRIYLGNEFCERLIPDAKILQQCLSQTERRELPVSFVTPLVSDSGLRRLSRCFAELPAGSEVVVNDWGVLRLLRRNFDHLVPVVGRLLCKMIKDPRLPSAAWAKLYPHGVQSAPFHAMLEKFAVSRLDVDVPPFATKDDFCSQQKERSLSIHMPYGYAVKGRLCRVGSTQLSSERKFSPGHGCQRECLTYVTETTRAAPRSETDLVTFQRGNTLFYKHSTEMTAAVTDALAQGWINRLVFPGDWYEDHRTH